MVIDFPESCTEIKKQNITGSIYLYKNDPKVVKKGINVSNFQHAQGGFLPLLGDSNYLERKLDNTSYNYDDKINHGMRPMHKTTFSNKQKENQNNFIPQNKIDFQGIQLRPEQIGKPGNDLFKAHFDFRMESNERNFLTSYQNQYYFKNTDEEYKKSFEIMPKYSLPKQILQLEQNNKLIIPVNRQSNIKSALVMNEKDNDYFTQYTRTHSYLGAKLGPGEPKEYPDRASYDPLTGNKLPTPSWSFNRRYNRISGDAQLHSSRKEDNKSILD